MHAVQEAAATAAPFDFSAFDFSTQLDRRGRPKQVEDLISRAPKGTRFSMEMKFSRIGSRSLIVSVERSEAKLLVGCLRFDVDVPVLYSPDSKMLHIG